MILNKTYGGLIDLGQIVLDASSIADEVLVLSVRELEFLWC